VAVEMLLACILGIETGARAGVWGQFD